MKFSFLVGYILLVNSIRCCWEFMTIIW